MTTRAISVVVLLSFCVSCSDPLKPDPRFPTAEKIRGDALAAAKKEGKSALIVFSMQGNIWCESLDRFHADPLAWGVLGKHLVLGRVDIQETPGGMHMFAEHGFADAPAFSILDYKGMLLSNSSEGGQNFGFPNNEEQVANYITAVKLGCPRMTDEEIAVLRSKLEEMRQPE
jgi:hypothetical protein